MTLLLQLAEDSNETSPKERMFLQEAEVAGAKKQETLASGIIQMG